MNPASMRNGRSAAPVSVTGVDLGHHHCSVPHQLMRQEPLGPLHQPRPVEVLSLKVESAAAHHRTSGNRQHSGIRDHMPANLRIRTDWTPERIRSQAARIWLPNVQTLCRAWSCASGDSSSARISGLHGRLRNRLARSSTSSERLVWFGLRSVHFASAARPTDPCIRSRRMDLGRQRRKRAARRAGAFTHPKHSLSPDTSVEESDSAMPGHPTLDTLRARKGGRYGRDVSQNCKRRSVPPDPTHAESLCRLIDREAHQSRDKTVCERSCAPHDWSGYIGASPEDADYKHLAEGWIRRCSKACPGRLMESKTSATS